MSFYDAERQFVENVKLFGNPQTQPEKYNLYNGLGNLARSLRNLEDKVDSLLGEVRRIKSRLP